MPTEDDHPPPRPIHMFEAMRPDAPARFEDAGFGRQATGMARYAGDDARDLGLGKLGKGATDIAPGPFGDAQKGVNATCQRAAEGGSAIERQKSEHAEQRHRSAGLQTITGPGRPGSNARPSRDYFCGSIAQPTRQA